MVKKLQAKAKDNNGSVNIGITKIASLLRENETKGKKEPIKERKGIDESSFFQKYGEKMKGRDYNIKETLYVDEDVKEVFSLLKSKGKIQISSLVSFILEEWISNNIEEVKEIIEKGEKNRFL